MRKILLFTLTLLFVSGFTFAQDSTKAAVKAHAHHASKKFKRTARKTGKKIDSTAHHAGNFVKKSAVGLASDVSASRDKSMHGPNDEKVFNGPRGGKYYVDKAGKKIYLKKDRTK